MEALPASRTSWNNEELETRRFIARHNVSRFQFQSLLARQHPHIDARRRCRGEGGNSPRYNRGMFLICGRRQRNWTIPPPLADALTQAGFDAAALLASAGSPKSSGD